MEQRSLRDIVKDSLKDNSDDNVLQVLDKLDELGVEDGSLLAELEESELVDLGFKVVKARLVRKQVQ